MLLSLEKVYARKSVSTKAHLLLVRLFDCSEFCDVHAGFRVTCEANDWLAVQVDSEWAEIEKEPSTAPGARVTAANMCYIIFTSGSTGRPKGTVLQHAGVINYLLGMVKCAWG